MAEQGHVRIDNLAGNQFSIHQRDKILGCNDPGSFCPSLYGDTAAGIEETHHRHRICRKPQDPIHIAQLELVFRPVQSGPNCWARASRGTRRDAIPSEEFQQLPHIQHALEATDCDSIFVGLQSRFHRQYVFGGLVEPVQGVEQALRAHLQCNLRSSDAPSYYDPFEAQGASTHLRDTQGDIHTSEHYHAHESFYANRVGGCQQMAIPLINGGPCPSPRRLIIAGIAVGTKGQLGNLHIRHSNKIQEIKKSTLVCIYLQSAESACLMLWLFVLMVLKFWVRGGEVRISRKLKSDVHSHRISIDRICIKGSMPDNQIDVS